MNRTDPPALPASEKARKTLPGWKAILVRQETFERLHSIQTSTIDPRFDLRYIGDAAVQMALDRGEGEVLQRTREEVKRRL
jgi:hypothetical protein